MFTILWSLRNGLAVLTANDGFAFEFGVRKLLNGNQHPSTIDPEAGLWSYHFLVSSSMIPVAGSRQQVYLSYFLTRRTYWWVLTMAVRLILPACICSFRTGATLDSRSALPPLISIHCLYALIWVRWVDNHSILGIVVDDQVGIVVTTYSGVSIGRFGSSKNEDALLQSD